MFNKIVAVVTAVVGANSLLAGVAALPTNVTESAIAARAIDPNGNNAGQVLAAGGTGMTNASAPRQAFYPSILTLFDIGVAAISHELYDNYPGYAGGSPNNNPVCGRTADITYIGKTIRVGIVDRCGGCALWDVDLSPSAFQQFTPLASGRLYGATWHFN
ncbi:hypothetical protein B0J17DRAFT_703715 [Rhizoctonia solani]|nr:hypothetical protein B0J17DRAFT_703715 [Rhizoctonia solani]